VARELLGCVLARRVGGSTLRARIVETEAYIGEEDLACHARAGRTPRTDVMYGPPGIAYVYFTYGMHHLLNAVTERVGMPAAVLIRAAEPLDGIERMARARSLAARRPVAAHHIASGPSRLCQALGIDLRQNHADLRGRELWIEAGDAVPDDAVRTSPRIGCSRVPPPWGAMPWRYFVAASAHVTPGRAEGLRKRGGNGPAHRE
jgi:DNA-3-methyladenine glycosylase